MKILLTGVTGYIGRRLLPVLLQNGHEVYCCVRDVSRFDATPFSKERIHIIQVDFLNPSTLKQIPQDIDIAYYLIHSMSAHSGDYAIMERNCAENFKTYLQQTQVKQVIYLSGIVNDKELSKHLTSRKGVENILKTGTYHFTCLRAGIIIGSGSASFEIIRDLVEKLPVMVAPRWIQTKSQPIAVRNVLHYLVGVINFERAFNQSFDIGGPKVLTYKAMLLQFAKVRGFKRYIYTVPVMTPKLSSYWLFFVTSTSYKLAINLVDSMKNEVICKSNELAKWLKIDLLSYETAVQLAFDKIEQENVLSSWTDALNEDNFDKEVQSLVNVPRFGCLKDRRSAKISSESKTLERIWAIGGDTGWYQSNWLWEIRGLLDKLVGGVGLRRGRKNPNEIKAGEVLDFWRVIYASKADRRLLLYAEMKLPGEAWLEFKIRNNKLYQVATFRPKGIWGRMYWYSIVPLHFVVFSGMVRKIAQ